MQSYGGGHPMRSNSSRLPLRVTIQDPDWAAATGGRLEEVGGGGGGRDGRPVTPSPITPVLEAEGGTLSRSTSNGSAYSASSSARSPSRLARGHSKSISRSLSTRSHNSVRAIGSIPIGSLCIHQHYDSIDRSMTAERNLIDSITEEDMHPPSSCLRHGDIFLVLDLPAQFLIGHDDMCVTATEPLPGFRDIPPGVHLLWVQPNDFGPRCGYWYIAMDKGAVRVKQWDRFNEVLGEVATQVEVRNQTDNIESTYPTLKPYNMRVYHNEPEIPQWQLANDAGNGGRPSSVATDPYQMWCALTSAITTPFLETVTSKKSVTSWLVNSTDCVKGDSRLPGGHTTASRAYKTSVGSDLDFLFLQDFRDLKVLDNRSTRHLEDDTTDRVLACLGSPESVPDIVAELQFTCLTGIHLANYACMEQWWNLVLKIILRAHKLVLHVPELVQRLLKTLHDQLVYAAVYLEPVALAAGGNDWQIFQIKPQNKSKLRLALAIYKRRLNDTLLDLGHQIQPRQTAVGETFDALEAWLGRNGWDLRNGHPDEADDVTGFDDNEDSDDDDDDLPVVVDVDENGRERGLVSFHRD